MLSLPQPHSKLNLLTPCTSSHDSIITILCSDADDPDNSIWTSFSLFLSSPGKTIPSILKIISAILKVEHGPLLADRVLWTHSKPDVVVCLKNHLPSLKLEALQGKGASHLLNLFIFKFWSHIYFFLPFTNWNALIMCEVFGPNRKMKFPLNLR